MYGEIPTTSDIVLQGLTNRELVERFPSAMGYAVGSVSRSQEPVYGFRAPAMPENQGDLARAADLVDDVFSSFVAQAVEAIEDKQLKELFANPH